MSQHTCTVCAAPFESPRKVSKYCSNRCGAKASYERRRDAGTYNPTLKPSTCVVCATTWMNRTPGSRYCSKACQDAVRYPVENRRNRGSMSERVKAARHKQHWAARGKRGTTLWTSGRCRVCNAAFVSEHRNITCSDDCYREYHGDGYAQQRSISRMSRRARERNAFVEKVDPLRVFESDGYRCHLCKRMTLKGKTVPHPRAPTVDHVIPLAAEGKHEPRNCRTACFLCNSTKSHHGGGQLLLLAI